MEISILYNSEVKADNPTCRFDAEFFKHEYLDAVKGVERGKYSYIDEVTSWVTQGSNPVFSPVGIPCLTGRNINKGEVSYIGSDYIDEEEYKNLSRYQLKKGDTLITLKGKGSIGKIGYVTESRKSIFSRDIGVVRPNNINPGYLNVFILCKYGKLLVDRGETGGTGQSTLTTSYLKIIPVPRFDIEDTVGDLLYRVENLRQQSKKGYEQAESILLSELGLANWQPKHQLTFIKNYSDTEQAERIDAEYYQPKYEDIVNAIKSYSGGWDTLDNLVELKSQSHAPKSDKQYKYIELSNIAENGEITGCTTEHGAALPSRARRKVNEGDVIVSSIEGSLSSIALVEKEYDKSLCSTGFYVISSDFLNSETLLVLMKSIAGQMLLKRGCNGTILTAINKDEFLGVTLPKLLFESQVAIKQKVTESFRLRKQSKHLLECAKRAVEIAIEQDEQAAIDWLKNQIGD